MNFQRFWGNSSARLVGFLSLMSVVLFLTHFPGSYALGELAEDNVCTRIKRMTFVPNYREETRTAYRVVQGCCSGLVKSGRRCVTRPAPDTAATTSAPTVSVSGVTATIRAATLSSNSARGQPEFDRDAVRGKGAGTGVKWTGTEERWRQGLDAVPRTTGPLLRGKGGTDIGVKGNHSPGISGQDGAGSKRHDDAVLQDGASPNSPADGEGFIKPAIPDIHPKADSGMMFLTGMLCGGGVLSVAAFVVIFLMWRQRRGIDGRLGGIPFLQSTRSGSGTYRKSKLLALAQSIKTGEVKLIKKSSQKENGVDYCPYSDIEQMPKGIRYTKSTESLPDIEKKTTTKTSSISFPKMMSLQVKPTWTERGLPPEPPTYAIIQKTDPKRKAPEAPTGQERPSYSRVYATPDCIPIAKGDSHTVPRDFNMSSPRHILCESQHIYADIQRKSKASTWSCSKRDRPKSLASTGEVPHQESRSSRSLSRSLSRNSLRSFVAKRGSNGSSSGYSSLVGSRENVFDNYESVEERSGLPKSNIYSETIPKDLTSSEEHYDKLDFVSHDRIEYDKLSRAPTTPRSTGIVKTFSKKYEKLTASTSNR